MPDDLTIPNPTSQTPPPAAGATVGTPPTGSSPPPPPPTAQTAANFREYAQQKLGTQIPSHITDQQLFDHVFTTLNEGAQAQKVLSDPTVQSLIQDRDTYLAWKSGQRPSDPNAKPEWQAEWSSYVVKNEFGRYEPAPGAPPEFAVKANNYSRWLDDRQRKIAESPLEVMKSELDKYLDEREAQRQAQTQPIVQAQAVVASNRSWMQVLDSNGNALTDLRGQPQLTPAGQEYLRNSDILWNEGLRNVELIDKLAKQMMTTRPWETPAAPAAAKPAGTPDARSIAWNMNQAGATRTGSANPGNPTPNQPAPATRGLSFREKLIASKDRIFR